MSQKRIAFRASSAKTCPKAKKGKESVDRGQFGIRYDLFCVKGRASSLAFEKVIKELLWTLVRARCACALAQKRSRAAVKARGNRLGKTREWKKHSRAGKTRRGWRRDRGYLRATYPAKEYVRDNRRVVSAVTAQKRRRASAHPIPMLGYHLKGNTSVCATNNEYYKSKLPMCYYR